MDQGEDSDSGAESEENGQPKNAFADCRPGLTPVPELIDPSGKKDNEERIASLLKEQADLRESLRRKKREAAEEKAAKGKGRGKGRKKSEVPEKNGQPAEETPLTDPEHLPGLDFRLEAQDAALREERSKEDEHTKKRKQSAKAKASSSKKSKVEDNHGDERKENSKEETNEAKKSDEDYRCSTLDRTPKSDPRKFMPTNTDCRNPCTTCRDQIRGAAQHGT